MPLYEYVCRGCHHHFEALTTASSRTSCPTCASDDLERQFSVFAVGKGGSPAPRLKAAPSACGHCGDPRGPGACQLD